MLNNWTVTILCRIKNDDQSSVVSANDTLSFTPVQKVEEMLNAADFDKIMTVFNVSFFESTKHLKKF